MLFEERAAAVRQNVLSLGWDVLSLERSKQLFLLDARIDPEAVISGDFSIKGLLAILDRQCKAMRARRIVFDALDTLLQLYVDTARERHELNGLQSRYSFLDFMADCVIHVDRRVTMQVTTRRLRVVKYRGSGYGHNEYPFIIGDNGINVNQAIGSDVVSEISGIGISSIIDTVVALRHLAVDGETKRQLVVMKSRGSSHSDRFHDFRITDRGIELPQAQPADVTGKSVTSEGTGAAAADGERVLFLSTVRGRSRAQLHGRHAQPDPTVREVPQGTTPHRDRGRVRERGGGAQTSRARDAHIDRSQAQAGCHAAG